MLFLPVVLMFRKKMNHLDTKTYPLNFGRLPGVGGARSTEFLAVWIPTEKKAGYGPQEFSVD